MRIVGILLVEVVVVIDKIDGPECAVFLDFPHDTSYAVSVVGVVFPVEGYAVIARGEQAAVGGDIESHPLVHDGQQVLGPSLRPALVNPSGTL